MTEPIQMLLWCPGCGERHIDEGDFATRPHHTHACQVCGLVWRPAVENTCGAEFLPGFKSASALGVRLLWCVHVYGPGTYIAQPDQETALRRAAEKQAYIDKMYATNVFDKTDPVLFCWAEPWPYRADGHARALAEHGGDPEDWC